MSTINETMALVALIQCIVVKINEEGQSKWTEEHHWIAPENLWVAARDGLEGMMIVDLQGKKQKISEAVLELIEDLIPFSKNLNCEEELSYINNIIETGNGAQRQRKTFNETGSLKEVVSVAHQEFISSLHPLQIDSNL